MVVRREEGMLNWIMIVVLLVVITVVATVLMGERVMQIIVKRQREY